MMNTLGYLMPTFGSLFKGRSRRPDPERVKGAVDLEHMKNSHVLVVGVGGAVSLIKDLARCGIGRVTAVDPDHISETNIWSQDCRLADLDRPKVEALGDQLREISPELDYRGLVEDFLKMTDEEMARLTEGVDLILMMTDNFFAQARGNLVSLKHGIPTLFAIVYTNGEALEVTWNLPGVTPACHRCVTAGRYRAYSNGFRDEVGSSGATVFSGHFLNGVLGFLSLAILHRGRKNRFGTWMERAGQRNFLHVRLSPDFVLQGLDGPNDLFGRHLGTGERVFCFDSLWTPPDDPPAYEHCPDCGSTGDLRSAGKHLESTLPVFDSGEPMYEGPGSTWMDRVARVGLNPGRASSPEHVEVASTSTPAMVVSASVYEEIRKVIGVHHAERGGMLVGDRQDPFRVRLHHYDAGGSMGAAMYDPDYHALNRALKELYEPNGLDMLGFVHSHPAGVRRPSGDWGGNVGDMAYASATLQANPDLQVFLMPIVMTVPDSGKFEVLPFLVFRDAPTKPVLTRLEVVHDTLLRRGA